MARVKATPRTNKEVRAYRRAHEVTQVALAAELGCSDASYRLYESHNNPLPRGMQAAHVIAAIDRLSTNGGGVNDA